MIISAKTIVTDNNDYDEVSCNLRISFWLVLSIMTFSRIVRLKRIIEASDGFGRQSNFGCIDI